MDGFPPDGLMTTTIWHDDAVRAPSTLYPYRAVLGMLAAGREEIEKAVVKLVRDKIGPVAAFKMALVVSRAPARFCAAR